MIVHFLAVAFACNMSALNHTERDRLYVLLDKLTTAAVHRQELPNGYRYDVDRQKLSLAELAEWVSLESRCCPFLNFDLQLSSKGALYFQLTGDAGVKQFIEAEMHRLPK
jgi:hypothetical protein